MSLLLILLNVYFVTFTDKPDRVSAALSPRAYDQREKWSIPMDELDYPVGQAYLDSLRSMGATIHHTSRWFNGATCTMDDRTAAQVAELGFVSGMEMTRDNSEPRPFYHPKRKIEAQYTTEENEYPILMQTSEQLALYNLHPLHSAGFHGQGILMAICDGGFYRADTLSCFRQEKLELGHFDFTDDKDVFYGHTGTHGTECLSAISGMQAGYLGAATEAQYYLMRSEENATESPKEMDNLVAAIEKADSLGVNVFSVSLGYYYFDQPAWDLSYEKMDGASTRVSRAATIAARKGMLVCVAAGNEGTDEWHWIDAPADADSILTVGAVDTEGKIADFSSYGPSYDGRVKPEVCAVGARATLISPNGVIIRSNGTSFATPLLAGMAASLWSALPEENAMQIRERIIQSASRYNNPDTDQYGYGIPDAWKAYKLHSEQGTGDNRQWTEDEKQGKKIIRNGQLYLKYKGQLYDVRGARVDKEN